jgi:GNAT superfamily N-acetyltransferase
VTIKFFTDLTQYQLITGGSIDRAMLLKFLRVTYQELYPQQPDYSHLESTVDRYLSPDTPVWFVTKSTPTKIACLWLGIAIDQVNGIRHPNTFLIYVDPAHRRQGIARALMQHAETWAKAEGYTQLGLQVFTDNQAAIDLYHQLGYQAKSISMIRAL